MTSITADYGQQSTNWSDNDPFSFCTELFHPLIWGVPVMQWLWHCKCNTGAHGKTLLEAHALPRAWPRNPRQRLCRGLPSAKTPRGIFRRRRGLCRGPFIGHSAKPLPRARTTLGKEKKPSSAGTVGGFFAEGRPSVKKWFFFNLFAEGRLSANKFFYFFKKTFAEGLLPGPRQRNFQDF